MEHRCLHCKFLEVNLSTNRCYCSAGGLSRTIEFYNPGFIKESCVIERIKEFEESITPKYSLGQEVFIYRDGEILKCRIVKEQEDKELYWDWYQESGIVYCLQRVDDKKFVSCYFYSHYREQMIYATREECENSINE